MKSFYVKMCRTLLRIITRCRIPRFLFPKSNHIYSVWQHLVLLALRQYESKSYRRFADLLQECTGIQEYLGLETIPHYTTLQKAAARLEGTILHKMLSEFVLYKKVRLVLAGIDGTGFSYSTASYYYTKRINLRRKFLKIVLCADMNSQLVCTVAIHHDMAHDNPDFLPLLEQTNQIVPVDIALGDMGFDDENNHVGAKKIGIHTVIPTRYADVPIWRTGGIHRKEMKRNFPINLYHQRNKSETIYFVTKQLMSDEITSRNYTTQDNEILLRLIAYNVYRIIKLEFVILIWFLQGLSCSVFFSTLQHIFLLILDRFNLKKYASCLNIVIMSLGICIH